MTRQKTDRIKLVLVKWRDATHQPDDSIPHGTMIAWTLGFEVQRTPDEIVLCMEIFEDKSKREVTSIPMGMVKSVRTLATIPVRYED